MAHPLRHYARYVQLALQDVFGRKIYFSWVLRMVEKFFDEIKEQTATIPERRAELLRRIQPICAVHIQAGTFGGPSAASSDSEDSEVSESEGSGTAA